MLEVSVYKSACQIITCLQWLLLCSHDYVIEYFLSKLNSKYQMD
jgi:hypothetical protein